MAQSAYIFAIDAIQARLKLLLKAEGFGCRGRTFNRLSSDGLTQVINIQAGAADPPSTVHIPGLRENMHGLFTINLGVHVPEVLELTGRGNFVKSWVQEYSCCIRTRLGNLGPENGDLWWKAIATEEVVGDVKERLMREALPFLERFGSRDKILKEWANTTENSGAGSSPPRIVRAMIHVRRGEKEEARKLLSSQAREAINRPHRDYVRDLAAKLELGSLDE